MPTLKILHISVTVMGLNSALLLKLVLLVVCTAAVSAAQTKAGCSSSCGNVSIPYPFGTSKSCYIDQRFFINCTTTSSGEPIAYLTRSSIPVLNISLDPAELTVSADVSRNCYDSKRNDSWYSMWFGKFTISNTKNRFTVVGCDTYAHIRDLDGSRFQTGCSLSCSNKTTFENGSCSGVGCCQTSFPKAIRNYTITLRTYDKYEDVWDFNPCGYAFLAQEGSFNFTSQDLLNLSNRTRFPVVIDWAVDNRTCDEAKNTLSSYACKQNSKCQDSVSGNGYLCVCEDGFKGNPYLSDPDSGCKDTNECARQNNCSMRCHNHNGGYTCSCPLWYRGDGYVNGSGCKFPVLEISLGISIALLVVFTLVSTLCWGHKQRALIQLRRRYFEQNGGNMLQQLHHQQGYTDRTKIFTEEELKNVTNNFDESRILGRGGQGTVYKGILPDSTPVAIKKSKIGGGPEQIKDFINEVAVLSQINHRNVVKLLGCCLETEIPLLVYEFVDNGTLLSHIDPLKNEHSLSWETRLRIAAETAEAISYLHSAASIPIIHRDIKSANILLDHDYRAKVSDFGASRLVPLDEIQVTTMVQGTLGYLDPEYLLTGLLNEKSDVYSFGVVLVELLTGNKAVEFSRPEQRNLAMYFMASMKEDKLWEILDKRVLDQKNAEQLKEVAFLARRCIRVNGEERPTMKEVAMELEGLIAMEKHPWVKGKDMVSEECEYLLGHIADGYGNASASNSTSYDTIQKQIAFEIADGR
ncbi:wall-associated receptor kinase 2-like [Prosopis cineraria]|uniref:wall-associated receptor kinase 2-like n=1 Tax=Prosopis cineraria TaxID=364024 RepID=UPI00240F96D7|nr:wall-associated receptor kinase 2-like [Prosopis cineraria]